MLQCSMAETPFLRWERKEILFCKLLSDLNGSTLLYQHEMRLPPAVVSLLSEEPLKHLQNSKVFQMKGAIVQNPDCPMHTSVMHFAPKPYKISITHHRVCVMGLCLWGTRVPSFSFTLTFFPPLSPPTSYMTTDLPKIVFKMSY